MKNKAVFALLSIVILSSCEKKAYPDKSLEIVPAAADHGALLINENKTMNYYLYLPAGYGDASDAEDFYPLLVNLHWGDLTGEVLGPEILASSVLSPLEISLSKKDLKSAGEVLANLDEPMKASIILVPQSRSSSSWDIDSLHALILELEKYYRIDQKRIYFTGMSFGGMGTWNFAVKYPEMPAALMPVSGSHSILSHGPALAGVPTWAFHAVDDTIVAFSRSYCGFLDGLTPDESDSLFETLPQIPDDFDKTVSGTDRYPDWKRGISPPQGLHTVTLLASGGHDIWGRVIDYANAWNWLFDQSRP